jgi:EcsC protein family
MVDAGHLRTGPTDWDGMALGDMTPYDRTAWEGLTRWRDARLSAKQRHLVPEPVRRRAARAGKSAQARFNDVPGADQFVGLLQKALSGLLDMVGRTAEASLRRRAVVEAYNKRGHSVSSLEDIRKLELRDVDQTKPRLGLRYTAASTAEGAAAGLAMSGGEIVAGGGAVFGAGAGGAPGAGLVAGTIAADAVAVLATMIRAIAHTAAYYGYDTELPEEQVYAAGVLSFGLAQQAGKSAAYIELNKVVQDLARKATWKQLNKNGATKAVRVVYESLGMRLTREKLGQAIPVLGIALGAGINAHLLSRLTDDADHLYRERFLREKYGLALPAAGDLTDLDASPASGVTDIEDAEVIPIVQIVDEELERPNTIIDDRSIEE